MIVTRYPCVTGDGRPGTGDGETGDGGNGRRATGDGRRATSELLPSSNPENALPTRLDLIGIALGGQ